MTVTPTRRERIRTATVAEIKDLARRLLVTGGPTAISLRAIARDMGMTAPAIYRYFPSFDALLVELVEDLYDELRGAVESARSLSAPPAEQLADMARAFRRWSLAHPAEFGLMFGSPVPGVQTFEKDCVDPSHAGARFGAPFIEALTQLWETAPFPAPPAEVLTERLGPFLAPYTARQGGEVPVEVIYTYLTAWTRLYGMVALEVFGHLSWSLTSLEPLFETELASFVAQMTTRG